MRKLLSLAALCCAVALAVGGFAPRASAAQLPAGVLALTTDKIGSVTVIAIAVMDIIADGAITAGIVAIGTIAIGAIVSGVTIALGEMATTVVAITTIAPMRDRTTVPLIVGRMRTALACAGGKPPTLSK